MQEGPPISWLAEGGESSAFSAACVRHLTDEESEDGIYWRQLPAGISKWNRLIFCLAFHWKVNLFCMGKMQIFVLAMNTRAVAPRCSQRHWFRHVWWAYASIFSFTSPNSLPFLVAVYIPSGLQDTRQFGWIWFPLHITTINYFWQYWRSGLGEDTCFNFALYFEKVRQTNGSIMTLHESSPCSIWFSVPLHYLSFCPGGAVTSAFLSHLHFSLTSAFFSLVRQVIFQVKPNFLCFVSDTPN